MVFVDDDVIITGEFQIGFDIKPLDPQTVSSVVQYGTSRFDLVHEARGQSLIYSQLYPFDGLQNYTSGIIHHVRLIGDISPHFFPSKSSILRTFHITVSISVFKFYVKL